jgi:hypothetical protein
VVQIALCRFSQARDWDTGSVHQKTLNLIFSRPPWVFDQPSGNTQLLNAMDKGEGVKPVQSRVGTLGLHNSRRGPSARSEFQSHLFQFDLFVALPKKHKKKDLLRFFL